MGKHPGGRPRKYQSVEDMKIKIDEYFKNTNERPYTVTGLALYLDLTTEGLREYESREEYSATIKKAKMKIEDHINKMSLCNGYNATIAIFNLKNNFGWKDKQEIEQNVKAEVVSLTQEEKEKKLKELKERLDGIYD